MRADGEALWLRYYNQENLLFREQDFRAPGTSPLFQELWQGKDAETRALVGHLLLASQGTIEAVPLLDDVVGDGKQTPRLTADQEHQVQTLLTAGAGQIRKGVEDHRGRRHQPPVGEAEMNGDFPDQSEPDRHDQAEPGPRPARHPGRRGLRHDLGLSHQHAHGHKQTEGGNRMQWCRNAGAADWATAHLAPLAIRAFTPVCDGLWRGPHGKKENQNSAWVRGPLHDSERLRIVEGPPHPTLSIARRRRA